MSVLIKTTFDYADEFDCCEMCVMADEDYEIWLNSWERRLTNETVEIYFGTNEALQIMSFEEFKQGLEVSELTEAEAKVFDKFFDGSFGTGNIFNQDWIEDEDHENFDDLDFSDYNEEIDFD